VSTPDEERPAGSPPTASAGAARPISRIGLGIVIVVAVLFVAGVVTLTIVAARQDTRVLTRYTGSPPVAPASPAHKPSAPSGNDRADGTRPQAGWVRQVAERTGVPARALFAYARTDLVLHAQEPACKLPWVTLAGIGRVESAHGGFGGATLDRAGRPSTPIFGVALDGAPGIRQVPDTDHGVLDGDTRYDRAVGPMQFIPTSWATWATDADGDGRADPQDIDDAALAAGRYLCSQSRDLSTAEGWWAAVLSYNNSVAYAQQVLDAANTYAHLSLGVG
jgi:membrane-bound lytic murein transglycosylase B